MRLLSFDTSSQAIHICLLEAATGNAGSSTASLTLDIAAQHVIEPREGMRQETSALLMPGIVQIMESRGWTRTSLDVIVVGQGPGSFTGVRTGVVTARTLAQALHLPLIGVCLLECYAFVQRIDGLARFNSKSEESELDCAVVIAAGKGNHFAARYKSAGAEKKVPELTAVQVPFYAPIEQIAERFRGAEIIADDASAPPLQQLGLEVSPLPSLANIAVTQAQIASNRLHLKATEANRRDKLFDSFHYSHVEPLYLRGASVTIKGPHNEAHRTEHN